MNDEDLLREVKVIEEVADKMARSGEWIEDAVLLDGVIERLRQRATGVGVPEPVDPDVTTPQTVDLDGDDWKTKG